MNKRPHAYLMFQWVESSPVVIWRIFWTGALEVLVDGILVVVVVEAVPHRAEHHVLPRHLERNTTGTVLIVWAKKVAVSQHHRK